MVDRALYGTETGHRVLAELAGVGFTLIEESVSQSQTPVGRQQNTFAKVNDCVQFVACRQERSLHLGRFVAQGQSGCGAY